MQSNNSSVLLGITLCLSVMLVILTACSSDNDNSTTNSSTVSGVITGFGSVFVGGVKYETNNASILNEDNIATESSLAVGMVVTVQGTINDDGSTGTATRISYDDNVEGIVLENMITTSGKLDVMGQIVNVNNDTTFESNVVAVKQASEIVPGNVVEISGYSSGDGMILATRIEVKSETYTLGNEIEVKGIIKAGVTATQFMLGTLTIFYNNANLDDLPAMLVAGTYVEAKSTTGIDVASKSMIASKVELEDNDMDENEGNEVEIEGIVTNIISATEFNINGMPVIHNDSTEFEDGSAENILIGARLEVEGMFDLNSKLVAKKIEFRRGAEIQVDAYIDAIDLVNNNVTIFGKIFLVNNLTAMQDSSAADIRFFSLSDLAPNDRVEVHAYIDATGTLITTSLARHNDDMSLLSIQGPVDTDITSGATNITVFSVNVDLATNGLTIAATTRGSVIELKGSFSGSQFIATSIK